MAKPRKTWVYAPAKPKASEMPAALKAYAEVKARRLIDEELKSKYLKPPPAGHRFNFIAALYGRWYRHYFYFCARHNSPGPNAIAPFFETKFARMEYVPGGRFNLAFMRYAGQWVELFQDLSVDECLAAILDDPMFQPYRLLVGSVGLWHPSSMRFARRNPARPPLIVRRPSVGLSHGRSPVSALLGPMETPNLRRSRYRHQRRRVQQSDLGRAA